MREPQSSVIQNFFRLGPIVFKKGITGTNVYSYFIIVLFSTCMMALINFMQPYLLTEYLNLPKNAQGATNKKQVSFNMY